MKISFGRLVLVLCLVAAQQALGRPGDVDLSLDAGSKINGAVEAIVTQPDGKILIGGSFTTVPGLIRHYVARMNADGTPDLTFDPGSGPNGSVLAMALQPDGKIIIGGEFTVVNGGTRRGIARLNPDGSLDTSFNSNLPGNVPYAGLPPYVQCLALQPDGKIFVGGVFSVGGAATGVARLMPDGTVDYSFYPWPGAGGVWPYVRGMALQPDGGLIVIGEFTQMNNYPRNGVARLNPDGSLDMTYAPTVTPFYNYSISLQPDGKLLLGGMLAGKTGLFRLLTKGTVDPGFNVPLQGGLGVYDFTVEGLGVQPDGRILMAAYWYEGSNTTFMQVSRLNVDGSIDPSFYGNVGGVEAMSVQPDGSVILGGGLVITDPNVLNYYTSLVRLDATGAWQTNFNTLHGIKSPVLDVALQGDGKILVGGFFRTTYENPGFSVARLNHDGSTDMSFTSALGPFSWVSSMTPQPDGKIVVCGNLFLPDFGNTNLAGVARLNADGTVDGAYSPPIGPGYGFVSAIQPDEKMLVAGQVPIVGAGKTNYFGIVRLNSDGTLDPEFQSVVTSGSVTAVALQPDGRILIGGDFTNVDGFSHYSIARLNSDGSLDASFSGELSSGGVFCILPRADGKIFVGGSFDKKVSLLNADGSFDNSFWFSGRLGEIVPGRPTVYAMAEGLDGKLMMAGNFGLGPYTNHIGWGFLQLNTDGSVDTNFNSHPGADIFVAAAAKQPDGNFVIAGQFTSVNGEARTGVARLFGEGPVINRQPTDRTTAPGRSATFSVAASGSGTLSYQWFKNGTSLSNNKKISGTTTDTLVISHVRPSDAGSFTVTVSNSAGIVTSDEVQLHVQEPKKLPPSRHTPPPRGGGNEK